MPSSKTQPREWGASMHYAQEIRGFFQCRELPRCKTTKYLLSSCVSTQGSLKLAMRHQALWDAKRLSSSHPSEILFLWPQNVIWTLASVRSRFPEQKAGKTVNCKAGKQTHLETPGTDLITHRIRQGFFGETEQHPGKTNQAFGLLRTT